MNYQDKRFKSTSTHYFGRLVASLFVFFCDIWCNPDVMERRSLLRWWQTITATSHHLLNFVSSLKKEGSICNVTMATKHVTQELNWKLPQIINY